MKAIYLIKFAIYAAIASYEYATGSDYTLAWAFLAILILFFYLLDHITQKTAKSDIVTKIVKDNCDHEFVFDKQITVVGCTKCKQRYFYQKDMYVDIYSDNFINYPKS